MELNEIYRFVKKGLTKRVDSLNEIYRSVKKGLIAGVASLLVIYSPVNAKECSLTDVSLPENISAAFNYQGQEYVVVNKRDEKGYRQIVYFPVKTENGCELEGVDVTQAFGKNIEITGVASNQYSTDLEHIEAALGEFNSDKNTEIPAGSLIIVEKTHKENRKIPAFLRYLENDEVKYKLQIYIPDENGGLKLCNEITTKEEIKAIAFEYKDNLAYPTMIIKKEDGSYVIRRLYTIGPFGLHVEEYVRNTEFGIMNDIEEIYAMLRLEGDQIWVFGGNRGGKGTAYIIYNEELNAAKSSAPASDEPESKPTEPSNTDKNNNNGTIPSSGSSGSSGSGSSGNTGGSSNTGNTGNTGSGSGTSGNTGNTGSGSSGNTGGSSNTGNTGGTSNTGSSGSGSSGGSGNTGNTGSGSGSSGSTGSGNTGSSGSSGTTGYSGSSGSTGNTGNTGSCSGTSSGTDNTNTTGGSGNTGSTGSGSTGSSGSSGNTGSSGSSGTGSSGSTGGTYDPNTDPNARPPPDNGIEDTNPDPNARPPPDNGIEV